MAKKRDNRDRIIDAALSLAAAGRWRDVSLAEIAEAAGMPLSQVYTLFSSKQSILNGFTARIDTEVLEGAEPGEGEAPARDRLFDVLMRRFDALKPHKTAIANIAQDELRDPVGGLCGLERFRRSMACMLEAADLSTSGLRGVLRIKAIGAVYLSVMRVWLRDDTPDLARTMAALDRRLRGLDRVARFCSRPRQARAERPEPPVQSEPPQPAPQQAG